MTEPASSTNRWSAYFKYRSRLKPTGTICPSRSTVRSTLTQNTKKSFTNRSIWKESSTEENTFWRTLTGFRVGGLKQIKCILLDTAKEVRRSGTYSTCWRLIISILRGDQRLIRVTGLRPLLAWTLFWTEVQPPISSALTLTSINGFAPTLKVAVILTPGLWKAAKRFR
jgi:hypothetical protein